MSGSFQRIELEYPVRSVPRWGQGRPGHAGLAERLARHRERYAAHLRGFLAHRSALLDFAREPDPADPARPAWINGFLPGLDSVALYGFLRALAPRRYVEIGSGNSTRVAHRAIRDGGLATRIVSIDPHPRAEIAALCDVAHRVGLEEADLALFEEVEPGDVVFLDGSHRVFMNSDATVFFLEVLPRLPAGVLVEVHDVFLPDDYPAEWTERFYSEQYLLASWLLADSPRIDVELPCAFVSGDAGLRAVLAPLWNEPALAGVETHGCSFWLRTR